MDKEKTNQIKVKFDTIKHMLSLSGEAFHSLLDLMRNSSSDTVRLNAAKDILSRAGFDATARSKLEMDMPNDIIISITE